jgi:hypothetical protein
MRIAFYADHRKWSQLANNGGTRTILLSAETLNRMGHSAVVVAHKDRFTWFKHPKPVHGIPAGTNAVVAVTISDATEILDGYLSGRIRCGRIAYWGRPYETWQMAEADIYKTLKRFVKVGGVVMVNSEWQQQELAMHGIPADVVYQGYDLPPGELNPGGPWEKPYYIGCQYSTKPRKRWGQFAKLREILKDQDYRYVAFGDEPCKARWLTKYIRRPSRTDLETFYRGCHFFFCPNDLEGLYNCAIEAALGGCLLVVSDKPHNGMADFCNESTAEVYHNILDAASRIEYPSIDLVAACQQRIVHKIWTRELNMARMVEVLSAQ